MTPYLHPLLSAPTRTHLNTFSFQAGIQDVFLSRPSHKVWVVSSIYDELTHPPTNVTEPEKRNSPGFLGILQELNSPRTVAMDSSTSVLGRQCVESTQTQCTWWIYFCGGVSSGRCFYAGSEKVGFSLFASNWIPLRFHWVGFLTFALTIFTFRNGTFEKESLWFMYCL